jgi:activator of 2-hydroxyglutaryl-CoA dehydratase
MNMNRNDTQQAIGSGKTVLGIEFGSTRIKAVLIGEDHTPIASGSYDWENRYENGIWTYSLEDIWTGLQESYRKLSKEVFENYNTPLLSAVTQNRPLKVEIKDFKTSHFLEPKTALLDCPDAGPMGHVERPQSEPASNNLQFTQSRLVPAADCARARD